MRAEDGSRDHKPLRYSQRALELVSESTYSHFHTYIYARTHTGRIEYESIAALAGCVPAVTALMLTAADGSVQSRLEQDRVRKRRRQNPHQYRG